MQSPLLVFAMPEESKNFFPNYNLLHTGIGKVNATFSLTSYLTKHSPSIVINLGTAGSRHHKTGAIINCTSFIQRDMDVTKLGFNKWQTPFSTESVILNYGKALEGLTQGSCGTGDSFGTDDETLHFDVVDMEAYALALMCKRHNTPFLCLKYISDNADDNANIDFNKTLTDAATSLFSTLIKAGY